jgi:hypothetical protein
MADDDGGVRATKGTLMRNAEISSFAAALELEKRTQTVRWTDPAH